MSASGGSGGSEVREAPLGLEVSRFDSHSGAAIAVDPCNLIRPLTPVSTPGCHNVLTKSVKKQLWIKIFFSEMSKNKSVS